ncbi:MAG: 3-dehydroquinate synthase [Oscillospiraceae bacterium]|jgi:3-dehydroquinate synthase|nr:3-dehydroquinate synthase [Oscillospiraceae bacterium]
MRTIHVNTGAPYDILLGKGLFKNAGSLIREASKAQRAVVVTDSNIAAIYLKSLEADLTQNGFEVSSFVFPAGEQSKRLSTIEQMYTSFAEAGLTRSDIIIALGGGVTGDMAGFAAATWQRGVSYVQIPTSLLAQIDSSVGGKTAVDLPQGKNLVGAFHQPKLVIIDPEVLSTLLPEFFADGMAEAIKYGCIRSRSLFERLEEEDVHSFLEDMIYECVCIKRDVVERDEKDTGERMLLNFGHTLGHAIEGYYNYTGITHGEAVAVGMYLISSASEAAGKLEQGTAQRLRAVLERYRLPYSVNISSEELCRFANMDKKRSGKSISLILISEIGEAYIYKLAQGDLAGFVGA